MKRWRVALLLGACFAFRLLFGLSREFFFEDETQIFLLGFRYQAIHAWPFFGPDVVWTRSEIPGALQALLVGVPLRILAVPESPFVLLNVLSFAAIAAPGCPLQRPALRRDLPRRARHARRGAARAAQGHLRARRDADDRAQRRLRRTSLLDSPAEDRRRGSATPHPARVASTLSSNSDTELRHRNSDTQTPTPKQPPKQPRTVQTGRPYVRRLFTAVISSSLTVWPMRG